MQGEHSACIIGLARHIDQHAEVKKQTHYTLHLAASKYRTVAPSPTCLAASREDWHGRYTLHVMHTHATTFLFIVAHNTYSKCIRSMPVYDG